jgi:hypothetical protein
MKDQDGGVSVIHSFMNLRTLIGVLGMSLPALCVAWCLLLNDGVILNSLSRHYYTNFRDAFVGILVAMSLFLVSYRGYAPIDNAITWAIGACGLCVALFPCESPYSPTSVSVLNLPDSVSHVVHCAAAAVFFALLACNSFFLFTRSSGPVARGSRKYWRNATYRACGVVIIVALASLGVTMLATDDAFQDRTLILVIEEAVMLVAFGVSWFVKGGAILQDNTPEQ